MTFITGLLLIDATASALNNSGDKIPNARTENTVDVKYIHTKQGDYPYVSAQAFRAWLRDSIISTNDLVPSPIYRDDKVVYTDGNPIAYWDDDLFGYMRAPGEGTRKVRETDQAYKKLTPLGVYKNKKGEEKEETLTRLSPFRVSTLVSIAPVYLTSDYGIMARQEEGSLLRPEADPAPYEHRFYRATLQGLISLNLGAVGTFYHRNRTGYKNLDQIRVELAKAEGLTEIEGKAFQLSSEKRLERVKWLLNGLAQLQGGAKLTVHYTDVSPSFVLLAVTKGGNHIFKHVVNASERGEAKVHYASFEEALRVYRDQIVSDVYVGWVQGYLDSERTAFETFVQGWNEEGNNPRIRLTHPRTAFTDLAQALESHPEWLG